MERLKRMNYWRKLKDELCLLFHMRTQPSSPDDDNIVPVRFHDTRHTVQLCSVNFAIKLTSSLVVPVVSLESNDPAAKNRNQNSSGPWVLCAQAHSPRRTYAIDVEILGSNA